MKGNCLRGLDMCLEDPSYEELKVCKYRELKKRGGQERHGRNMIGCVVKENVAPN